MVFELDPKDKLRFFWESKISAVSAWALDLVLKKCNEYRVNAARKFFESARREETTEPIVGTIWERQAHLHLRFLKKSKTFPLLQLINRNESSLDYPGDAAWVEFRLQTLGSILTRKMELHESCYLKPVTTKIGAVDSLLFTSAELVLLQVTYAMEHDISINGLRDIQHCLNNNGPLGHLRPTVKNPWRFIFVVPEGQGEAFQVQKLTGDRAAFWESKINQYVLELSYDDVWKLDGQTSA
jgi:hypothetical protein